MKRVILHCWGTNYYIAGLDKLEKITFNTKELKLLYNALENSDINGIVVVSTCNRFEIYWATESDIRNKLTDIISYFKNSIYNVASDFYYLQQFDAFKHLTLVNLGFDSMINLEEDISNQIKNSYILASNTSTLNKLIHLVFQNTIHLSRHIKNKYKLIDLRYSLTDCVTKIILKIFSNLQNKNMLVLGTGILAKNIINRMHGVVKSIGVYSHHKERINNLMVELNKKVDKVTNKNDFKHYDIIIASSSSCGFVITPDDIGEPIDKMIVFDLAVPRNISPEIASIKNIFFFSLNDIYNFHREIFKEKSKQIDTLKNTIENEILHMWNRILIETSGFNWNCFNSRIKSEIFANLKTRFNGNINDILINRLTHNILKNVKNNLIEKFSCTYI